jgi:hypothetical protein
LLGAASNKALKNLEQMLAYGQVYGTGSNGSSLVYEAVDFFGKAFEKEFEKTGDGLEKLMDGLATYDLTQQGQLEEFLAYARALGVDIHETDEETKKYITQLRALSAATRDLSFDNAVRNV